MSGPQPTIVEPVNASSACQSGRPATVILKAAPSSPSRGARAAETKKGQISHILSLTVPVTVTLAEREMSIDSVLGITLGTIIEFAVSFDSELSLQVANRRIGRGHAVKVGEKFGLRVTQIDTVEDRINAMGTG